MPCGMITALYIAQTVKGQRPNDSKYMQMSPGMLYTFITPLQCHNKVDP